MGNEASSEAQEPSAGTPQQGLPHGQQPRAGTNPTCLRWPHGGKTAYICGSFTHWQKMPMQWRQTIHGGEWYKVIDLATGSHQYKFIIDGQWRHDHTAPTVLDNLGNVNNCIVVNPSAEAADVNRSHPMKDSGLPNGVHGAKPGGAPDNRTAKRPTRVDSSGDDAGGSDSNLRAASDPYYLGSSNGVNDSYGQVVPPREELMMHHAASLLLPPQLRLLLPHHHGDATTMPLMVQMHHVFCHLDPEFRIFAMVHRYRDKSVTQLMYKPTAPFRERDSTSFSFPGPDSSNNAVDALSFTAVTRRSSELRQNSKDVRLQSVRISSTRRSREDGTGQEYTAYLIDSVLLVHGVETTLRSERRYKHFNLLDELLRKEFPGLVPQALPAKRPFGNLHPGFVEERRIGLEKYLQQCITIPQLASSTVFCHFVEADAAGAEFDLQHSLKRVVTKEGFLFKRGRKVCSWKRRYFCIYGGVLYYYYTAEIANPFRPLDVVTLQNSDPSKVGGSADGCDSYGVAPLASACVMVQPDPSTASLKGKHVFAIHTSQRTWYLAADTAHERSEWIRVLCEGGSQLSASSVPQVGEGLPPPRSATNSTNKMRDSDLSETEAMASDEAVPGLDGVLWKRASKVHVNQISQSETGKARGWVQRHFRLLRLEGLLVYLQNSDDSITAARGFVQLSNFVRVEDAYPRDGIAEGAQLHAFQLVPVDLVSDHAASDPLVLAASTAAEKADWMERLATILASPPDVDDDRQNFNADALETKLAAASIS
ncbi:hypothetical protein AB1Y20_002262 [Prymnesium parvum]|uniref:Uncharacterized protein n=1 Tax=Prymnesium parvum TaxID=97485 RepID=A0AB34J8N1_PRYPA|eukprot:CAMPEP_0182850326 /NCGR_PEP_ID=MMETSP0006_2-20121128/30030_1 /TAXON_ID=97485 /ORGANISM="Prymnesium parvum, Strain Texoma1" /LENGTH=764 /DNA_ID=CAMNT_0024980915 /DNA_START=15 /DNA_END=2309 /DNA_ORIENTATION=+